MGQLLSRNLYYKTGFTQPDPKKCMATLSTGAVAYMEGDPNGKRDDGSQGTSSQQLILYVVSSDRSSKGVPAAFLYSDTSGVTNPFLPRFSMCVDSGNNIHCVYVYYAGTTGQASLRYRKATYNSGLFSWGAEVVISAYAANRTINAVDIDIPSTSVDYPLIAAVFRNGTAGNYTASMTLFNKTSGGSNSQAVFTNLPYSFNTPDVSLACETDTPGQSDIPTYVVTFNPGPLFSGQVDPGDSVYAGRVAVGGVFNGGVNTINTGLAKSLNGGYRNYWAFYLQNDYYLIYGEQQTSPNQYWFTVVKVASATGAVSVAIPPRTGQHTGQTPARPAYALGAASVYRLGNGNYCLSSYLVGPSYPIRADVFLSFLNGNWSYREPPAFLLPADGLTTSATIKMVYGNDASRFTNSLSPLILAHYVSQGTTYVYKSWLYTKSHLQTVSAINSPTEQQTVGSNQITARVGVLYAPMANDQTSPSFNARVQIQMATNSSFTSGLYTATQDVSLENPYSSTSVAVAFDLSGYPLSQTTWYMRGRMIDSLGNVSSWSDVRQFRVSHPARPDNAQPSDQGVIAYINGSSTFLWEFTDPYVSDSQYAYQLTINKTSDGSIAYDSGKVVSGNQSLTIDLGSANLESYYDWYLTLWDAENIAGPVTYIGNFLFTGVPSPAWVTPATDGGVITTAVPVISWASGVGALKTQSGFRVVVRQNNILVYDSNVILRADTTYQIPTGYLHNGYTYQVDLQVYDSVGLGATITRNFKTSWSTPAAPPAPALYVAKHDTFGYVAVKIDQSNADASILYYNIYRRALDRFGVAWQLVNTVYDLSGTAVYLDYLCPGGVMNEYTVTQVADRFGDAVESSFIGAPVTQYASPSASFWLIDADAPRRSCVVPNATANSYTEEYEKTDYTVVNGGRQVEEGERVGYTGTVSSQIRPRANGMGGSDVFNLAANANLLLNASAAIDGGYITVDGGAQLGGVSFSEVTAFPGPGNRGNKKLGISGTKSSANANQISVGVTDTFTPSPYARLAAGLKYNVSAWVNIPAPVAGYEVRVGIAWYYQGTLQSYEYSPLTTSLGSAATQASETQTIGSDTWYRISRLCTVPGTCDEARLVVSMVSTGTAALATQQFFVEGLQVTQTTNLLPFLNGYDYVNGVWAGVENFDPVYSPGFVSPRWVKQAMEQLRRSGHDLYLRSPFGDIWKVYVNDLAISNVAGTGPSEFVDMDIPYLQVR